VREGAWWDLVDEAARARLVRRDPEGVPVSALTGNGVEGLREAIAAALPRGMVDVRLLVPYRDADLLARLYREGEVRTAQATPSGTQVSARVPERLLAALDGLQVAGREAGPRTVTEEGSVRP
jgi:GTP-binding protein HflX